MSPVGRCCRGKISEAKPSRRPIPGPAVGLNVTMVTIAVMATALSLLVVASRCVAAAATRGAAGSLAVSPLHGLSPLAKPHYSYPPSAALLTDPAAEAVLLDFVRLTGSLAPPAQEDPATVHRTVELYVHSVALPGVPLWPAPARRLPCPLSHAVVVRGARNAQAQQGPGRGAARGASPAAGSHVRLPARTERLHEAARWLILRRGVPSTRAG
jgi:hypothetical protein